MKISIGADERLAVVETTLRYLEENGRRCVPMQKPHAALGCGTMPMSSACRCG